mmetsp:Transcript_1245/g.3040  ORF Transcript_1245/g.3040 Transcript_1245/m.3040 type:complete len:372 (-) Transcript_1245:249-1364(-)
MGKVPEDEKYALVRNMSRALLRQKANVVAAKEVDAWNEEHFSALRLAHRVPDTFLEHTLKISHSAALPTEGKGGSPLYMTQNRQFIVKEVSSSDHDALLQHGAAYVEHVLKGGSLMVPIYMHFCMAHPTLGGRKRRYIAMKNLMVSEGPWIAKFDLKACADDKTLELHGKKIQAVHKRCWRADMWCSCAWSPERWRYYEGKVHARNLTLNLPAAQREELVECIGKDVDFLVSRGLMDYSLLLGVRRLPGPPPSATDESPSSIARKVSRPVREFAWIDGDEVKVLTVGIIDFLQPFTPSKWAAMFIKFMETRKATIPPGRYGERFKSHFERQFRGQADLVALPEYAVSPQEVWREADEDSLSDASSFMSCET